jgi:predicted MPP superfamily phosphohydrolase
MRSYTNKEGELITVSKEHLDIAIRIKQELQKASPSRKCAWRTHKQLMEREGFFDSDTNEQYRCMIKAYQKDIGELPEAPKYADMVADSKLESIKELVGEIAYEKRESQHVLRELNKVKRDVIDSTLIAEQIGRAFTAYDWSKVKFSYQPITPSNKKMIVAISDLHIGAVVNTDVNTYNYEVALRRMNEYLNKVITEIKNNDISEVYLINLGDAVENPYMHNLAFNCEFNASDQIVRATDIIIKAIVALKEHAHVTVAGIAGNHDRYEENKNKSLDGDHVVRAINYSIQSFITNSKVERVTYEQADDYEHRVTLNGVNVKFLHGDLDGINDMNLIAKHSALDGIEYHLILMGHYHHHWIKEQGINKTVVGFGTLKGSDGYSKKIRRIVHPSQGIVIIDGEGNYEIKSFKLK